MLRPRTAAVASLLLIPMVAGGFFLQQTPPRATPRLFDQVMSIVASRYVDSLQSGEVFEKAAKGLVRELNDPYSELLAPRQSEEFNRSTGGRYGGVGMLLEEQKVGERHEHRRVAHLPAHAGGGWRRPRGRPHRARGLAPDRPTRRSTRCPTRCAASPARRVQVTFQRPGVAEPVKLSFSAPSFTSPRCRTPRWSATSIGYIPLQTFNENTADEVEAAAAKLVARGRARPRARPARQRRRHRRAGARRELALPPATASRSSTSGRATRRTRSRARRASQLPSQPPLVILTDGGTASASEIVAGALQDHDRALVLGTTSFGKGLVQSLFPLDGGYALKITTGKWYTPSGRSIHRERKLLRRRPLRGDASRFARDGGAEEGAPTSTSPMRAAPCTAGAASPPTSSCPTTPCSRRSRSSSARIAPKAQSFVTALNQYAFDLKPAAARDFTITPAWRTELRRRLDGRPASPIDAKYEPAATQILDRELDRRVSRLVLGDAGARQRSVAEDHQLARAMALLSSARSQEALFAAGRASATHGDEP